LKTEPLFKLGDKVYHLKSKGLYRIVGIPGNCILTDTDTPAYIYTATNDLYSKRIYIRSQKEMEDGRFKLISKCN